MTVSKGKVLVWSNKSRRLITIGNIIWIPQNATGYYTMNFSVVY